jgi:hypothetical protein
MAIRLLKTSLKKLRPGLFFDAQESRNEMEWPFDYLKHRFIYYTKVVFEDSRKQILISQGHLPTQNIT